MTESTVAEIERRLAATELTTLQLADELDTLLRALPATAGAGVAAAGCCRGAAVPGKCPRKVRDSAEPLEHGAAAHHPQRVPGRCAAPTRGACGGSPHVAAPPPSSPPEGFTQTALGVSAMPLVDAALSEVWPHVHGTTTTGQGQNQIDIQNSFSRATAMSTSSGGSRRCMAMETSIEDFPAVAALTSACILDLGLILTPPLRFMSTM